MVKANTRLSHLAGVRPTALKVERNLLRERAAETLRDHISGGRIPEGTKLTEREVAQLLGISQMTAHEALMILEAEGLVVSRSDGRYVIELTEKDVRDLHELRWTLERLAAERAAANINEENRKALHDRLAEMEAALESRDPAACTRCDTALHQTIWQQAGNPYLLRMLDSVLGAIFVLIDRGKLYGQGASPGMLRSHQRLVAPILVGDDEGAGREMVEHLQGGLAESLRTFHLSEPTDAADPSA
jgi:DNA-binding GntR family transcriptional regulator